MRRYYGRGSSRNEHDAPALRKPAPTHCQICERDIYANNKRGLIAHHGYQRPGHGEQTSSCFGARWQPYEESRAAIPPYLDLVNGKLELAEKLLETMRKPGHEWSENYQKKNPKHLFDFETVHFTPKMEAPFDDDGLSVRYKKAWHARIRGQEAIITMLKRELTRAQARYDNWKPVEVKRG